MEEVFITHKTEKSGRVCEAVRKEHESDGGSTYDRTTYSVGAEICLERGQEIRKQSRLKSLDLRTDI